MLKLDEAGNSPSTRSTIDETRPAQFLQFVNIVESSLLLSSISHTTLSAQPRTGEEPHTKSGPSLPGAPKEDRVRTIKPFAAETPTHVDPLSILRRGTLQDRKPLFPRSRHPSLPLTARLLPGNKPEFCSVDHLFPPTNRGRSSSFQIDVGCFPLDFLVDPRSPLRNRFGSPGHHPTSAPPSPPHQRRHDSTWDIG